MKRGGCADVRDASSISRQLLSGALSTCAASSGLTSHESTEARRVAKASPIIPNTNQLAFLMMHAASRSVSALNVIDPVARELGDSNVSQTFEIASSDASATNLLVYSNCFLPSSVCSLFVGSPNRHVIIPSLAGNHTLTV